jgi:hypothetical protein
MICQLICKLLFQEELYFVPDVLLSEVFLVESVINPLAGA